MFCDLQRCPGFCVHAALEPKKKLLGIDRGKKHHQKKNKQQKVNKQHYKQQHHTAARFKPGR
ncbi:hypothetical protein C5B41_16800 [Acinetobacter ursingii]|nr:hypothetical protein C5B41_16800 [Acinetobacter ursingii]